MEDLEVEVLLDAVDEDLEVVDVDLDELELRPPLLVCAKASD